MTMNRLFLQAAKQFSAQSVRSFSNGARTSKSRLAGLTAIGGLAGVSLGGYLAWNYRNSPSFSLIPHAFAAVAPATATPQPNVYSQTKDHALYLWIHLSPEANAKECAKSVWNIQKYVDQISPPTMRDEDDEIWAGVGFGANFYSQVTGKRPSKNYNYPHRKCVLGDMPSTGGDIFIHAKSHSMSKLFEVAQAIQKALPKGSVDKFQDVYSFVYQNGRDLSGFIDGTENRADDEGRAEVALTPEGGSYCITQRWIHRLDVINSEKDSTMEGWLGRSRADSTEQKRKSATSHVARMTSGSAFGSLKPVEIVRQSMPYGTIGGEAGLFFIGYARDPFHFEYMLERMVGATPDGMHDDVMRLSRCVAGNYWYFPSQEELKALA